MLFPIKQKELERLIPYVATGNQFKSALGNPRKILQRVMISSIGGAITLLISQSQVTSRFYSIWLIIGVSFLLYILWGPILEASRTNSKIRQHLFYALFEGKVSDIYTEDRVENSREQANKLGQLELVEDRRTWLVLELEDEDGYINNITFPYKEKHNNLKKGLRVRCVVFSNRRDFSTINSLSDAWLPQMGMWVGKYPYLLRPAFEEFCSRKL